jgi:hypothetical protein
MLRMNDFLQNKKYIIIKNAVSKEIANFISEYFLLREQVANTLISNKAIPTFDETWGFFNDPQAFGHYSHYSDTAMETLLKRVKPIMEKKTGLSLYENYSYARIYRTGAILEKHTDRFSCEISTTLNLGGDEWPIYLKKDNQDIKVNLKQGDMLIYLGIELEHWREKFEKEYCIQAFLHFNNKENNEAEKNKFDRRPHLGLPSYFKK